MLTREQLPFPIHDLPKRRDEWLRKIFGHLADLRTSLSGGLRDPMHVQLPQSDVRMNVALAALLAVMLYVAAISLMAHHVLTHVAHGLDRSLQSRVTYEILPDTTRPDDRAGMESRAKNLIESLKKIPGITRASIIDRTHIGALLEPWLGPRLGLDQLPLPVLVDVQLDAAQPPAPNLLERAALAFPGVTLDNHAEFQSDLARFVSATRNLALYVLLLALMALTFTSYFSAQATFHMNREAIELLHLIGADDKAVAQHMGIAVLRVAVMAAGAAMALAFITLLALWMASYRLDLSIFPSLSFTAFDWLWLAVLWLIMILGAILACLLAARFTVLRALRRLL